MTVSPTARDAVDQRPEEGVVGQQRRPGHALLGKEPVVQPGAVAAITLAALSHRPTYLTALHTILPGGCGKLRSARQGGGGAD